MDISSNRSEAYSDTDEKQYNHLKQCVMNRLSVSNIELRYNKEKGTP